MTFPKRGYRGFLEWALALYAAYTAVIIYACRDAIPEWPYLFSLHILGLWALWFVPARGADWEKPRPEPRWREVIRGAGVFLRYMYPLLPALLFFEEGRFIVNGIYPDEPYWFESHIYAIDEYLFGDLPSIRFVPWLSWPMTELMHAFYFSYFVILFFGPLSARWTRKTPSGDIQGFRGPAFDSAMAGLILGFLCAYIWYPWIPARGPFENAQLMATLPPFEGGLFTFLARWITDGAAVSGNCFPSAHVAGTWGLALGVLAHRRKAGLLFALLAVGISVSCVYTRYHHGADVPAGILMGCVGAGLYQIAQRFLRSRERVA
jgi:hypothetical protein